MTDKKNNIIIEYTVMEDDSDWMSTDVREKASFELFAKSKEDIITFLSFMTDLSIHTEIMKELEQDSFEINSDLSKSYDHDESQAWVSTRYSLQIKYKN